MSLLLPSLTAVALAAAGPAQLDADIAWVASGKFCEPETVLPLPDDTLLVSNVCGFGEPGSGFLTLLDADGQTLNWHIVARLDAPLGMALHDGRLYTVTAEQRLAIRPVEVKLMQPEYAVITGGVSGGERVVVSDLLPAIDGMLLQTVDDDTVQQRLQRLAESPLEPAQ